MEEKWNECKYLSKQLVKNVAAMDTESIKQVVEYAGKKWIITVNIKKEETE